ncbi:dihydrodipicolinate synthase family protein [Rhodococcus sp. ABRD24]|uniref:dihydrodipicolinate synthase family protein n=1 Tax=Rhodococcus sp. ABRD24 TaxID=2507582 RepID=UPI00103CDA6D|nr:dihydrodipicolinate synthase family protein [Rhodococcus sp. ABRD24]QBJ96852.1 dihydrodipicolinate synthase family protein [Rhodococcus sp. ABRD24]
MTSTISGIVAYPVTPLHPRDNNTVNVEILHLLLDRMIDAGVDAIAPLGSTGESSYLDPSEWSAVANESIGHVDGRVPTVVGVSDLTTAGAVRRARIAESLGASAVMALPMSYWRLTEEEVRQHFMAIADAVSIPVMVYNNPATTGIDMTPEFLFDLVTSVDNITMVKESTGDVTRMHRLRELSGGTLPYFNGSNPLAQQAFEAGAAGWCTAAPCLIPDQIVAFHRLVVAGDQAGAAEFFDRIRPFLDMIVSRGLPTTIKSGLRGIGIEAGDPRRPLMPLDETDTAHLRGLIAAACG